MFSCEKSLKVELKFNYVSCLLNNKTITSNLMIFFLFIKLKRLRMILGSVYSIFNTWKFLYFKYKKD